MRIEIPVAVLIFLSGLAFLPGASATLPPGTYSGYWEPFQGEQPPTEPWYTWTAPSGTWSTDLGFLVIGSGAGNGAIFSLTSPLTGSWEITVDMGNEVEAGWPFVPSCDTAGDGSVGATMMARGAATATLFSMRVLMNCGTGAITQDFPAGLPATCNTASNFGLFTFSWDTATDLFTVDGPGGICTVTPTTAAATMDGLASIRFPQGVMNDNALAFYDDLIVNRYDGTTFTVQASGPEAPTGVSALVSQAHDGDNALIEIRWTLSPNDPDPVAGDFDYEVYLQGVLVATDTITGQDGDGVRYHLLDYSAAEPITVWVRAFNATSGERSVPSCSVSVDTRIQSDFDSCGTSPPGGGPGAVGENVAHTTTSDTAAGLQGFCSDLMGDSDASLFLCGLVLVVIVFMALAGGYAAITDTRGLAPAIAGSLGAFGMMVFNVFAGIWGIVWAIVLIILVGAIITGIVKGLAGLRPAGGSSGE